MEAYIVPDWLTVIAGLVVFRERADEPEVLMGLRSIRNEAGKWCLPTGLGVIRRDTSNALAKGAPSSLNDPMSLIKAMSKRHQQAFASPAGFALAEAQWYIEIPDTMIGKLKPVTDEPICRLDNQKILIKLYFELEWPFNKPPDPAKTEWPFREVRFFSKKELQAVPVAFGCDEDLDRIFW